MKTYYETGFRLPKEEKAKLAEKNLYVYERRDCGNEATIEPHVAVDFLTTLVTNFPIEFATDGPEAFVVYDGDAYLKANAKRVWKLADVKA